MARLVICYQCSDEVTYFVSQAQPIEYESAEALLVDFERAIEGRCGYQFTVGGLEFDADNFVKEGRVILPDILTLDEWFEEYKGCTV